MKTAVILYSGCVCLALGVPVHAQESPSPSATQESGGISPDKQWEYRAASGDEDPRIAKAGTNEMAVSLVDECDIGCEHANVLWAPDSKRFAFNRGDGKEHLTSVYQLRDGKWEQLKSFGEDDEIARQTYQIVDAQAKKKGLPKKTFLHMQWTTVEAKSWIDSSTLTIYSSLAMQVHRSNGDYVGLGFGADLLFTLKFDAGGNFKIVKTHQITEKEAEEFQQ